MLYKDLSDLELWQSCQKDDLRAYNELFDRYFPKLYRLSLRHVRERTIAEELTMDLLCNMWHKRHQLVIRTELSAYLFRSMKNLIINQLKKNIPVNATIELLEEHKLVSANQADDQLMAADAENVYRVSLQKLSPQRRRVFQLSREENLSYAEIAQEMNLSVNTVENYMVAALSSIRSEMKSYTGLTALLMFLVFTLLS